MKIPSKQELLQILTNYSFNTDFDDFRRLYRKFVAEPNSFIVTDTSLPSGNAVCF